LLARLEHVLGPARAPQDRRAAQLAAPARRGAVLDDVEREPRVRIQKLDPNDRALEREILVQIEVRDAVMRVRGRTAKRQYGRRGCRRDSVALHDLPPTPTGRHSFAQFAARGKARRYSRQKITSPAAMTSGAPTQVDARGTSSNRQ